MWTTAAVDGPWLIFSILVIVQRTGFVEGLVIRQYGGSCYSRLEDISSMSYSNAVTACSELGSKVVEIESEAEMDFVRVLILGSGQQVWTGLERIGNTDMFVWRTSGEAPISSLWLAAIGEPNYSGPCVRLSSLNLVGLTGSDVYYLADQLCNKKYNVLCEKDVDPNEVRGQLETITSSDFLCPMGNPVTKLSRLQCATGCAKDLNCLGFSYETSSKVCTYFTFVPTSCASFPGSSAQVVLMNRNCEF